MSINYQRTREMTIDELLLENRVVFLFGEINHASSARLMMQMLYLENQKKGQDINFYINSPGGAVDDTLAIYDTMRFLSSKVATYCVGRAYSGAAVLLAAGEKGKRFILPHAKVMIHQPYGGVTGQASDIQIQAEEILKNKQVLNEILAARTGRPMADIERDKELAALGGEKREIAFGHQIRSYVLHPYQMVKDHRTDHETGNTSAVLDGDIQPFIETFLRSRRKS
ncbi:MAG TPA: ATP-dependent Clp protease proteolytic subunit [Phycisphaerales bacterium]|nr:ATP-dependent Clp protease proteolytic subunit [Phycisphaerales bacterium]